MEIAIQTVSNGGKERGRQGLCLQQNSPMQWELIKERINLDKICLFLVDLESHKTVRGCITKQVIVGAGFVFAGEVNKTDGLPAQ